MLKKILQGNHIDTVTEFRDCFWQFLNLWYNEKRYEVAMMCLGIWKARYECVWQQKKAQVEFVVQSTFSYFVQWKHARSLTNIASLTEIEGDGAETWVKH